MLFTSCCCCCFKSVLFLTSFEKEIKQRKQIYMYMYIIMNLWYRYDTTQDKINTTLTIITIIIITNY